MAKTKQEINQRQNSWAKENKEQMHIMYEKGTKERIKAAADQVGEGVSEYVRKAVEMRLTGQPEPQIPAKLFTHEETEELAQCATQMNMTKTEFVKMAVKKEIEATKKLDELFM